MDKKEEINLKENPKVNYSKPELEMLNYINEIADKMWKGHTAAMVGTGFSMNAKPKFETSKKILSWNELGLVFMDKLGIDKNETTFQDPIKLAGEISADFGENTLNQIIKNSIPDDEFEPTKLFEDFLKLNWNDIFTTNYDTLLERTAELVDLKHYSVVTKDSDLVNSPKPRIIKLHGSFPTTTPFIITEEQFRTYPKTHAAFVNTVQQSLVENILVLIGFSGTDPNFLNWIGWIRDNLGINFINKVYLISVDSISNAKRKLFNERNINVVDLTVFKNIMPNCTKTELVEFFVNELISRKSKDKLNWAFDLQSSEKYKDKSIKEITEIWKSERLSYPGWIILPKEQRRCLYNKTDSYLFNKLRTNEDSISYIFEFNWRIEKSLNLLHSEMVDAYLKVIDFNKDEEYEIPKELNNCKEKVYKILLSLLKSYREDGNIKVCNTIITSLKKYASDFSSNAYNEFQYEQILLAMNSLNVAHFIELIEQWDIKNSAYIWKIKKSALMAEIGNKSEALSILRQTLQDIRKNQGVKEIVDEYYLYSAESLCLSMISYIQNSILRRDKDEEYIDRTEIYERNSISRKYKCNIDDELNSFRFEDEDKFSESKNEFDIEKTTRTIRFGTSRIQEQSYTFIRFLEETGFPLKVGYTVIDTIKFTYAISEIIKYNSYFALTYLLRAYSENLIKKIVDRNILSYFSSEKVSEIVKALIENTLKLESELINSRPKALFAKNYIIPIPELISRLSTKCDSETKILIADFFKNLYETKLVTYLSNIDNALRRYIKTLTEDEKIVVLNKFLEIEYLEKSSLYLNPVLELNLKKSDTYSAQIRSSCNESMKQVFNKINVAKTDSEKIWYLSYLISLFYAGVLNEEENKMLGELLWSLNKDKNGFPNTPQLRKFIYLDISHPDNIDVDLLYSDYLKSSKIPINPKGDFTSSWYDPMYGIKDSKFLTDDYCLDILNQIEESWNKDAKLISTEDYFNPFIDLKESMRYWFYCEASILGKIIQYKREQLQDENSVLFPKKDFIKNILYDFYKNDINCLQSLLFLINIFPDDENDILNILIDSMYTGDENKMIGVYNSIISIYSNKIAISQSNDEKIKTSVLDGALWRTDRSLRFYLDICSYFVTEEIIKCDNRIYINKVLQVLKNLRIMINRNTLSIDDIIVLKKSGARLSYSLFKKYTSEPIPEELSNWKELCEDSEDFVEIRNEWIK